MKPDETPGDRTVRYLEDFGRGVLGILGFLLLFAIQILLPLAVLFAVVYFAVKAAL